MINQFIRLKNGKSEIMINQFIRLKNAKSEINEEEVYSIKKQLTRMKNVVKND